MSEMGTTIYLLKFALETLEDAGLENATNSSNWVIGRDIEAQLKVLEAKEK